MQTINMLKKEYNLKQTWLHSHLNTIPTRNLKYTLQHSHLNKIPTRNLKQTWRHCCLNIELGFNCSILSAYPCSTFSKPSSFPGSPAYKLLCRVSHTVMRLIMLKAPSLQSQFITIRNSKKKKTTLTASLSTINFSPFSLIDCFSGQ